VVSFAVSAHDAIDGDLPVSCDRASGATFALGTTTVTCSASDESGNTGTNTFDVLVEDTTAPVFDSHQDLTAEAKKPQGANVGFALPVANDIVDGPTVVVCDAESDEVFALGLTTVTCTSTDTHGNTSTLGFTVSVVDTTAPAFPTPADLAAEATGPGGALLWYDVADATDAVDITVPVVCTPASGGLFPLSDTQVMCTATDAHNNTATESFTVTVEDTTAPALTMPPNAVVEASAKAGTPVTWAEPTAEDVVDGDLDVTCTPASGSLFGMGVTAVTCSAIDAAGNEASGSFSVTVQDKTKPVVTVPQTITAEATGPDGAAGAAVTYGAVTASDLVDQFVTPACDKASGSVFPLGTTTVTCSATDDSGNITTKSFTVTISVSWCNIENPINVNGTSVFKAGSTIPALRCQFRDHRSRRAALLVEDLEHRGRFGQRGRVHGGGNHRQPLPLCRRAVHLQPQHQVDVRRRCVPAEG
jgi:hypothetical protein